MDYLGFTHSGHLITNPSSLSLLNVIYSAYLMGQVKANEVIAYKVYATNK